MTDTSKLDFAARQRIYDEEIAREKRFRSMFLSFQEGTPTQYFMNPFRGAKHSAVTEKIGERPSKFLDKDDAFLRAHYASQERKRAASASGSRAATPAFGGATTPLPELAAPDSRAPTPSVVGSSIVSTAAAAHAQQHPSPSPSSNSRKPRRSGMSDPYGGYDIDANGKVFLRNDFDLCDPTTSEGRSLARMRMSNAVLKPRTQLVGDAVRFDRELKDAQRPPQDRYGYPRTAAHQIGWYHEPFNKVDRSPSAGGTRMSTGGFFLAKGLKTHTANDNVN